jgi:hypothetical protein
MSAHVVKAGMRDLLNQLKDEIFLEMNCHHIGIIESFDPVNQTATVQVAYKKTIRVREPDGKYVDKPRDYPLIADCPVVVLGGGGGALTFPIKQGDECLLLFNDRSINGWFENGQISVLQETRKHALTDAIAIVGVRSLAKSLSDYDVDRAAIAHNGAKVAVGKDSKVLIENAAKTLGQIMDSFLDALISLETSNAVPGAPSTLSSSTIAELNQIKTDLGGLLE